LSPYCCARLRRAHPGRCPGASPLDRGSNLDRLELRISLTPPSSSSPVSPRRRHGHGRRAPSSSLPLGREKPLHAPVAIRAGPSSVAIPSPSLHRCQAYLGEPPPSQTLLSVSIFWISLETLT
jgi:hypothetical protein